MSNLYVSILVLAVYAVACVGYKLRVDQLDRRRRHRARIRQINAYTMRRQSNVVSLERWSRKV